MSSATPTAPDQLPAEQAKAKALLDWLQGYADERGEVFFSDALQRGPAALRTKAPLEAALKVLADHGSIEEATARPRRIRVLPGSGEGRTASADCGVTPAKIANLAGVGRENGPSTPATALEGAAAWRAALVALSPDIDPCPGFFEPGAWARVRAASIAFVEEHGDRAHALGWTEPELFGVNPLVGVARPESCGALMLSRGVRVAAVRADEIRFANRFSFRRPGRSRPTVPVWELAAR